MIIQYILNFDAHSLFVANSISFGAFAVAFFFAFMRQRDKAYWFYLMIGNVATTLCFVTFLLADRAQVSHFMIANIFLVLGIALRWQAIRVFFYRQPSFTVLCGFPVLVPLPYMLYFYWDYNFIFSAINIIILVEFVFIIYELFRDRSESLPSRWGLGIAYSIIALFTVFRIFQSWFAETGALFFLQQNSLLNIHLLVVLVHIIASGIFVISLSYERGLFELRQMTLRDPLTDLYNRRAFEMMLGKFRPADGSFALIILDIDHFKRVNDLFGHDAGDIALKRCASILNRMFRKADFIARIGGEEFVIIMPETAMEKAFEFAERAREAIEEDVFEHNGNLIRLTISAGVCQAAAGAASMAEITRKADASLYSAKNKGRNRVEMYAA